MEIKMLKKDDEAWIRNMQNIDTKPLNHHIKFKWKYKVYISDNWETTIVPMCDFTVYSTSDKYTHPIIETIKAPFNFY